MAAVAARVPAVRPARAVVAHNSPRHVAYVMAQAPAISVAVMAGSLRWVWAKTTIARLAVTTMGSVRLVMAAVVGKNKYRGHEVLTKYQTKK